jgi:hypothetical protein
MATRIDQFRAMLSGGGARPTQFKVMLTFPEWVAGNDAAVKGEFLVKAASLPASTIQPIDVPFRGRPIKLAGERVFQNWNVTIINDNDFLIRNALERWSKGVLDHRTVTGLLEPLSYERDLIVQQLDRNDNEIKTYKMFNCWPQAISEIQLDYGASTNIEEFQVEFSVDEWDVI